MSIIYEFSRLRALVLGGLIFIGGSIHAQTAGFPLITSYSGDDIGADPTSWIVVQDRQGILYFGGRDLVRYDGDRWQASSMAGAHVIRGLDFSADGNRLWAGAIGEIGWFEQMADGKQKYLSLRPHVPTEHERFGEVWHVFAEANGALFVADEKIMRWDGRAMKIWPLPGPRHLRAFRSEGHIFVQHRLTGLYQMMPDGPKLVLPVSALGEKGIFWMETRGAETFLVTSEGMFMLAGGVLRSIQPAASKLVTESVPTHVTRLTDGRLAVSTIRGGIILLRQDGSSDRTVEESDGMPTRLLNYVFVDRDQQLWATSFTHICRISVSSASTVFDTRAALPAKPFYRITADANSLYTATDDAVYQLHTGSRQFERFAPLAEHVADLQSMQNGILAAAVRAVKRVDQAEVQAIYRTAYDTYVVQPEGDGILVADGRRVVVIDSLGEAKILATDLPDNAWSLSRDWQNRLWIGTETHGVLLAEPAQGGSSIPVSAASVLGHPLRDGKGIVRSIGNGEVLLLYSSAAWIARRDAKNSFQRVENYPQRTLVSAAPTTGDGSIWLVHTGGGLAPCIGRIVVSDGKARWQSHSVEGLATIGMPQTIFAQGAGAGTTILWIGGTSGILRHVVAHGLSAPPPRPPLLRSVARNSTNEAPEAITGPLPYSTRSIEFEFAEPDFTRRAALRLQTRFVGVDPDWIPADSTSRRTLTAVREGPYTFQVRAVAETGVASVPTTFRFEVLPPWWRTPQALFAAALGLIPIGYGFYRLRVRSLRRRNLELEEKVRRRTEEFERASAAKTVFVANMSHDIRNPLNGIVGLTLALEETRLEQRQREIVATLRECTTYLSTLVDDVLDFASIEAGKVELRPGPFVPNELLRSIVTTLKAETAERGALLLVEADPTLPASVLGDAGRIQQILVNYVSNALKYAGGHIRLYAVVPSDSPGEIEFSVADEGPGISEEEKATLFTKFTRLTGARRGDIPGAGLGLAACRLLADIMGGSVGVESEPGRGSRFYLRLPLTIVAAPTETAAPDLPNTTVLVVEDTDYNAWAAAAVLSKLGLSCERARTGAEALRLFGERRFNVVLLDRNLPDMDGTEVARQMRSMESDGLQAVLLAVTAYCTAEDRALCLKSGMDAFVGKPLTPEKLRRVLLNTGRRQLAAASVHVSPEVPQAPVLDLSLLKYLSDGTPEGLEAEIQRYLARLGDCQNEIATFAVARDWLNTANAAHGLHGHAKLISAASLAETAAQLERAANARDESDLRAKLRQLETEAGAVRELLRHHRSFGQPA